VDHRVDALPDPHALAVQVRPGRQARVLRDDALGAGLLGDDDLFAGGVVDELPFPFRERALVEVRIAFGEDLVEQREDARRVALAVRTDHELFGGHGHAGSFDLRRRGFKPIVTNSGAP
jgi:hypothetical protein